MKLKRCVDFAAKNVISLVITAVCAALIITMIALMIPKKGSASPLENVRPEVYGRGIEVCAELSANDSMVELARIYASGADITASMYFAQMRELENMCKTAPEELFFSVISAVVGLNLDAASLYADHEYERAEAYNKKSAELCERLKAAQNEENLNAVIREANRFEG